MASIGSGKNSTDYVNQAVYEGIVKTAVEDAGTTVDQDGQVHTGSNADPKGKAAAKKATTTASSKGGEAAAQGTSKAGSTEQGAASQGSVAQSKAAGAQDGVSDVASGQDAGTLTSGYAAHDAASFGAADHATQGQVKTTDFTAVSGLASANDQSVGLAKLTDAIKVLTASPAASEASFKQAVDDFATGMQALGKGEQTDAALRNVLTATTTDADALTQKYALAEQAGVSLGDVPADFGTQAATDTTAASDATADSTAVAAAKDQLTQDLQAQDVDTEQVAKDVDALQQALTADGRGDETASALGGILQQSGAAGAGASAVYAAAAMLGIPLDGDAMADARDKTQDVKTKASVRQAEQAEAKAKQQAALEAAAAQAKAAQQAAQQAAKQSSSGSGGTGGPTLTGTAATGDVSGIQARTGTVSGSFKMGVLPDYDNGSTGGVGGFISRTKVVPSEVGGYVAVQNGTFDSAAADRWIKEAVDNKVPTVSFSLSAYDTGKLTSAQLSGIKAAVDKAQAAGLSVQVRYGYEMNYGGGGGTQGGRVNNNNDPSAFKEQWAQVASVLSSERTATPAAQMVWSPNVASGGTLPYADWFPSDSSTVDVVALDYYHTNGTDISLNSISQVIDPIYAIAKKANVPFIFGETGVTGASGESGTEKQNWLNLISSDALREKYPLYQGFYWFDYNKDGNNYSLSQDASETQQFHDWYYDTFKTDASSSSSTSDTKTT